jgi:glucose uptake protein
LRSSWTDSHIARSRQKERSLLQKESCFPFVPAYLWVFYPLLVNAISPSLINPESGKLTPYTAIVFFSIGLLASFIWNVYLMRRPITGPVIPGKAYFTTGSLKDHLLGLLGGLIWCLGFSLMTLSAEKRERQFPTDWDRVPPWLPCYGEYWFGKNLNWLPFGK